MEYFSCCSQTITNLIERRVITPEVNGLFDLKTSTASYIRVLREAASGRSPEAQSAKELSLLANIALKEQQTSLAKIKVNKESQVLIPSNMVISQFKSYFCLFRSTLLTLPSAIRIALRLSLDNEEVIEDIIYEKMRKLEDFNVEQNESGRGISQPLRKPNGNGHSTFEDHAP